MNTLLRTGPIRVRPITLLFPSQGRGFLPLDHADRPQPGHFLGQAGAVDDVDHLVDVLVGGRLLLGQPLPAAGPGDDARGVQFLVDPPALRRA